MVTPTVHLNGTSAEELMRLFADAGAAVQTAMKAVEDAGPNGRDYYPQGPGMLTVAIGEHVDRIGKLNSVYKDLVALHDAVEAQTNG